RVYARSVRRSCAYAIARLRSRVRPNRDDRRLRSRLDARARTRCGRTAARRFVAGTRHDGRGGVLSTGILRVLVADDHSPTREEVCATLEQAAGFTVCAEVADAPAAVEAAVRERPDICLLDVRMPGSGLAAAWEIA